MTEFVPLLRALAHSKVQFILIGGVAATAHGSSRLTLDIDIVYSREKRNISLLVAALSPFKPYPRGAPPGLPFKWDEPTLSRGLNFTLTTTSGPLDLFGEIVGGGTYEALISDTIDLHIFGIHCACLSLRKLIAVKKAAGRPKDLESIAELEAILEERENEEDA